MASTSQINPLALTAFCCCALRAADAQRVVPACGDSSDARFIDADTMERLRPALRRRFSAGLQRALRGFGAHFSQSSTHPRLAVEAGGYRMKDAVSIIGRAREAESVRIPGSLCNSFLRELRDGYAVYVHLHCGPRVSHTPPQRASLMRASHKPWSVVRTHHAQPVSRRTPSRYERVERLDRSSHAGSNPAGEAFRAIDCGWQSFIKLAVAAGHECHHCGGELPQPVQPSQLRGRRL